MLKAVFTITYVELVQQNKFSPRPVARLQPVADRAHFRILPRALSIFQRHHCSRGNKRRAFDVREGIALVLLNRQGVGQTSGRVPRTPRSFEVVDFIQLNYT